MESIEETNRIRAAIGLPLLPVPGGGIQFKAGKDDGSSSEEEEQGSTLESRQAQGYDNWKKLQNEADAKAHREANLEKIKKARDTAKKYSKLEGKGLGDADDAGDLDTKTWLLQQKKRRKRLDKERLARLEKELAEREEAPEYTAADLTGVKVAHELDDFEGGEEKVLTLKDTTIDQNEEEGDELENVDLREREALNERLNLKKRKPVYDPHADEEGAPTILKHYDETIDGKKRKRFTLDGQGASLEEREALKQAVGERMKAKPISLDILKEDVPISDYAGVLEGKIKKPKKKKAKSTRQKAFDDDDSFPVDSTSTPHASGDMDIDYDSAHGAVSKATETTSFADDDDLQASLAMQRRAALKKRKKIKPEDIARQIREEATTTGAEEDILPEEVGMVIDETTEFVANLQRSREEKEERARPQSARPRSHTPIKHETSQRDEGGGIHISAERSRFYDEIEGDEDGDIDIPATRSRSYDDNGHNEDLSARLKRESSTPTTPGITGTGLDEEAPISQGLGATLSMLTQRGLIKRNTEQDINALHRQRDSFLTEKQKREAAVEAKARAQRERDRNTGKLDRMSAREREEYARRENESRAQMESRQMTDIFNREYKPDVQLKYIDSFGRSMDQREAFKHLSHQFHGKGSGKQKTEKHLKRIEDDKKRESQSTLDASQATGMNNAMGATAKKNRQAGVRLA
ncbi:U4/U6.U5 tri-snRNP-associated protein 1, partial [Lecanoromycetidae sp. Uapishka_2]